MSLKAIVFLLVVIMLVSTASATTFTVCPSGCVYSSIQTAINAANAGDTIEVQSGTYYEQVVIDKTLKLKGENRDTTIIDGGGGQIVVVEVKADNSVVSGFTLRNGWYGVRVWEYHQNNTITDNIASNMAGDGMHLATGSHKNIVSNNILNSNAYDGLFVVYSSNYNTISGNTANSNGFYGLLIQQSHYNTIKDNNITSNALYGIYMHEGSSNNIVYNNNLVNNNPNAVDSGLNFWDNGTIGNHWSDFDEPTEGCNDADNNGICDTAYSIPISSIDHYPLVSWKLPPFDLTFIVTDNNTGQPIANAIILSKMFKGKTDGTGTVPFKVPPGDYKFSIIKGRYKKVIDVVSISEDTTVYAKLIPRKNRVI